MIKYFLERFSHYYMWNMKEKTGTCLRQVYELRRGVRQKEIFAVTNHVWINCVVGG